MAGAQILVVEDEAIVARGIQGELTNMGYEVPAIASSGDEALHKAAETHPDLVLMDIALQGDRDGVETAEELRAHFDVPVVYLTAYADEDTLGRAKVTEPFGYLLKPYEERELHTTIEIALYKHKMESLLHEHRQWLTATLRCIGDAVIVTDANGYVRLTNRQAEVLTGWPQDLALGRDVPEVFRLVHGRYHTPLAKSAGAAVALDEDSVLLTRDGRELPVEGSVAPVSDNRDNFAGFVLTFRDVAKRRRAEEHLRQAQTKEALGRWRAGWPMISST